MIDNALSARICGLAPQSYEIYFTPSNITAKYKPPPHSKTAIEGALEGD